MTLEFKKHGQIIFAIIGALAILGTGWWAKGTEYEKAWIYILPVYFFFFAAFDVYAAYSKKNNDKDQ